ncbi:GID complex subunit containing RING finger motif, partial [Coemansia brasiliensis]
MDKINVDHMLAIEEPFIKQLKRVVRQSQKQAERETSQVSAALSALAKDGGNAAEAHSTLDGLIERLQTLKRKLEEVRDEESLLIQRSKQRATDLGQLSSFESASQPEFQRWSRARLDRILVDFMLRNGNVKTAELLAQNGNIEHFADTSLFSL